MNKSKLIVVHFTILVLLMAVVVIQFTQIGAYKDEISLYSDSFDLAIAENANGLSNHIDYRYDGLAGGWFYKEVKSTHTQLGRSLLIKDTTGVKIITENDLKMIRFLNLGSLKDSPFGNDAFTLKNHSTTN